MALPARPTVRPDQNSARLPPRQRTQLIRSTTLVGEVEKCLSSRQHMRGTTIAYAPRGLAAEVDERGPWCWRVHRCRAQSHPGEDGQRRQTRRGLRRATVAQRNGQRWSCAGWLAATAACVAPSVAAAGIAAPWMAAVVSSLYGRRRCLDPLSQSRSNVGQRRGWRRPDRGKPGIRIGGAPFCRPRPVAQCPPSR